LAVFYHLVPPHRKPHRKIACFISERKNVFGNIPLRIIVKLSSQRVSEQVK